MPDPIFARFRLFLNFHLFRVKNKQKKKKKDKVERKIEIDKNTTRNLVKRS